jgi:hypothetical protein
MNVQQPRLNLAYYNSSIPQFVQEKPETILGHLAAHHPHDLESAQRE